MSLKYKYFTALTTCTLLLLLIGNYLIYGEITNYLKESLGKRALSFAQTVSALISVVDFQSIASTKDVNSDSYKKIRQHLFDTLNHNIDIKYIYALELKDKKSVLVVDTENSTIGKTYPAKASLINVLSTGIENYEKEITENEWGPSISGYTPLKENGATYGLIGVDIDASSYYLALKTVNKYILAFATTLFILITLTNLKVAEALTNRQQLFDDSIKSLVDSINAKDNYTRVHSLNVAYYSSLIAQELGFSTKDIMFIEALAKLHDVGKIGIKDEILNSPGGLSQEEYETIKMHPVIGAQILSNITDAKKYLSIVLHHHERFDGKGYPDGLKGAEIPLIARIVAVADTYDAMTTDRPYRLALKPEIAIKELEKNKGSQFDPLIVDAFVKIIYKRIKENSPLNL